MEIIDKSFKRAPKNYVIQSLLAVGVILFFIKILTHAVIVAALGASTFIVFAMPHTIAAQVRRLVGGYIVGVVCGCICYYVLLLIGYPGKLPVSQELVISIAGALAVGLAIFLMAITNTEHPPAAATALGIVIGGWSNGVVIFILLGAISLALTRRLLRGYLKDLF